MSTHTNKQEENRIVNRPVEFAELGLALWLSQVCTEAKQMIINLSTKWDLSWSYSQCGLDLYKEKTANDF